MPFPPYPTIPDPVSYGQRDILSAADLRSDVLNAIQLLTSPPMFVGAQTGAPTAFTASATDGSFTAPGTAYATGTAATLAGGSLPGGFTAGTTYYTVNVNGESFQLASSSGGSAVTITSDGSGTITITQYLATGAWSNINLDTQVSDVWAGHLPSTNAPIYYGMLPGWYLAEFTAGTTYTGGTGSVSAGITALEGTSPVTVYGGQRVPASATASRYPVVSAAKLLQFTNTGTYGTGNYCAGSLYQGSGSNVAPLVTATRYPQLQTQWVSALSANPALQVPDNDPWPPPPQYLTSTFGNKNIRDTIGFLIAPPVFEASYRAGTATLAAQTTLPATGAVVALDNVNADTWNGWQAGSNTYRFPQPGMYYVYGQVATAALTTSTALAAGVTLTSSYYNSGTPFTIWGAAQTTLTGSGLVNCAVVRRRVRVNAGDTVSLTGFQTDTGSHPVTIQGGTWKPRLIVIWTGK